MLRRGAKRAQDRCQPGYRTRSVQQRQRKVCEIEVSVELRVSKRRTKSHCSDPSDDTASHKQTPIPS